MEHIVEETSPRHYFHEIPDESNSVLQHRTWALDEAKLHFVMQGIMAQFEGKEERSAKLLGIHLLDHVVSYGVIKLRSHSLQAAILNRRMNEVAVPRSGSFAHEVRIAHPEEHDMAHQVGNINSLFFVGQRLVEERLGGIAFSLICLILEKWSRSVLSRHVVDNQAFSKTINEGPIITSRAARRELVRVVGKQGASSFGNGIIVGSGEQNGCLLLNGNDALITKWPMRWTARQMVVIFTVTTYPVWQPTILAATATGNPNIPIDGVYTIRMFLTLAKENIEASYSATPTENEGGDLDYHSLACLKRRQRFRCGGVLDNILGSNLIILISLYYVMFNEEVGLFNDLLHL
eukprot:Gb_27196 [translate_table: standard]